MWSKILAQDCWCWKVGHHQESVFLWWNTSTVPGCKDHTLYNDILCLFCLGTRANFEDEKNSVTLCMDARVVMETTWELFWEKVEKTFMGKLGGVTRRQGKGGRTEGTLDNCSSPFRWASRVVASRYAGLHAVGALQTKSVIRGFSRWGCLVVQNRVVYHGSWRWERGISAIWRTPVALMIYHRFLFRICRTESGIVICVES